MGTEGDGVGDVFVVVDDDDVVGAVQETSGTADARALCHVDEDDGVFAHGLQEASAGQQGLGGQHARLHTQGHAAAGMGRPRRQVEPGSLGHGVGGS